MSIGDVVGIGGYAGYGVRYKSGGKGRAGKANEGEGEETEITEKPKHSSVF